jgi:hypothetical protein
VNIRKRLLTGSVLNSNRVSNSGGLHLWCVGMAIDLSIKTLEVLQVKSGIANSAWYEEH